MKRELELFLRNKNIVNQQAAILLINPLKFMVKGLWCTEYTLNISTNIYGLDLRGKIRHFENGEVEIRLVFSTYGDYNISEESYKRREKIIAHIVKHGAIYFEEPPIKWFN